MSLERGLCASQISVLQWRVDEGRRRGATPTRLLSSDQLKSNTTTASSWQVCFTSICQKMYANDIYQVWYVFSQNWVRYSKRTKYGSLIVWLKFWWIEQEMGEKFGVSERCPMYGWMMVISTVTL